MEYIDQVYVYLLNLRPGDKVAVSRSQDPARFVETVKRLMDNWGLRDKVEFNEDYTILRRRMEFIKPITKI